MSLQKYDRHRRVRQLLPTGFTLGSSAGDALPRDGNGLRQSICGWGGHVSAWPRHRRRGNETLIWRLRRIPPILSAFLGSRSRDFFGNSNCLARLSEPWRRARSPQQARRGAENDARVEAVPLKQSSAGSAKSAKSAFCSDQSLWGPRRPQRSMSVRTAYATPCRRVRWQLASSSSSSKLMSFGSPARRLEAHGSRVADRPPEPQDVSSRSATSQQTNERHRRSPHREPEVRA